MCFIKVKPTYFKCYEKKQLNRLHGTFNKLIALTELRQFRLIGGKKTINDGLKVYYKSKI